MRSCEDCFTCVSSFGGGLHSEGERARTAVRYFMAQALATAPVRTGPFLQVWSSILRASFGLLNQNVPLAVMGLPFEVVQPWVARWKASAISGAVNGAVFSCVWFHASSPCRRHSMLGYVSVLLNMRCRWSQRKGAPARVLCSSDCCQPKQRLQFRRFGRTATICSLNSALPTSSRCGLQTNRMPSRHKPLCLRSLSVPQ